MAVLVRRRPRQDSNLRSNLARIEPQGGAHAESARGGIRTCAPALQQDAAVGRRCSVSGAPGRIRTCACRLRRAVLLSPELRGLGVAPTLASRSRRPENPAGGLLGCADARIRGPSRSPRPGYVRRAWRGCGVTQLLTVFSARRRRRAMVALSAPSAMGAERVVLALAQLGEGLGALAGPEVLDAAGGAGTDDELAAAHGARRVLFDVVARGFLEEVAEGACAQGRVDDRRIGAPWSARAPVSRDGRVAHAEVAASPERTGICRSISTTSGACSADRRPPPHRIPRCGGGVLRPEVE